MASMNKNTPYEKAKAVWDSRMGGALKQMQYWRTMAIFCSILLGFSLAGNIYLGQKESYIPYVVAVRQNGDANILNTSKGLKGKALNRATKFFLSRFVMLAREIPADPILINQNIKKLYQMVSTQGKAILTDTFKEQNPAKEFVKKHRALKISSILEVSKGMYHLDWFEAEYDKNGQKIAEYPMRGTFKVAMLEPQTKDQIRENPLGIFIDYFSWTRLGG